MVLLKILARLVPAHKQRLHQTIDMKKSSVS
jgi:hypothetical protein